MPEQLTVAAGGGGHAGDRLAGAAVIEVKGLRKSFGSVEALRGVDFSVPEGRVLGMLGPNGAGKTTAVRILTTLLHPSGGRASVCGYDVVHHAADVRRVIGLAGQATAITPDLTGRENLEVAGRLYHLGKELSRRRAGELLDSFELSAAADRQAKTYSGGMLRRLDLAASLIGRPRVLFLDEPTTGMDPLAAREFRTLIAELKGEGRTILLTTHDMVEAETVCDRVTLIDRGRILATETPRSLGSLISRFQRIDVEDAPAEVVADVERIPGVSSITAQPDGGVRIEVNEEGATQLVLQRLVESGVTAIKTSLPSLEEVYVQTIGERGLTV